MARPPRTHARGFTLIELMIVMTVVALLAAAAGPALGGLTGADARKAAGELSGSMRWLFDSASVRHATCRLVLSPAERSFWAECAKGRTTIERDPEKVKEAAGGEGGAQASGDAAGFARFEDPIVRKRELPGGTAFKRIRIDGREPATEGETAYVHFFPGGRAQAASVTIADGDHVYTVRLEPFTGHARVVAGEPPESQP
ncbi:MAG TPA: prepilin-type N-terminal cleavage/methylation domain-containing protein [Anaeromyxobacteraceae bacterium]|nr:prepilin-type N-terminal cleavage/methylation domain-containing protein [Anaeromyxobacteraceae bacterium]